MLNGGAKNSQIEANKKFKPEFTLVNDGLNFAVQRRDVGFIVALKEL